MKSNWFIAVPFAAALLVAACSNNTTSTGSGSNGLACQEQVGGATSCVIYKNLSSAQQSAETTACSGNGLSVVSSCPTANLIGCCTSTTTGFTTETCYYSSSTSAEAGAGLGEDAGASLAGSYQTDCTSSQSGTWSTSQ